MLRGYRNTLIQQGAIVKGLWFACPVTLRCHVYSENQNRNILRIERSRNLLDVDCIRPTPSTPAQVARITISSKRITGSGLTGKGGLKSQCGWSDVVRLHGYVAAWVGLMYALSGSLTVPWCRQAIQLRPFDMAENYVVVLFEALWDSLPPDNQPHISIPNREITIRALRPQSPSPP